MQFEFILIGILSGFLAGLLGIGGGFIVVPALTLVLLNSGFTPEHVVHIAVATSLACMLITSLSSLMSHQRSGHVNWSLVRALAIWLVIGAILGAALADQFSGVWLARTVGLCALAAGLNLLFRLTRQWTQKASYPGKIELPIVGTAIGALSSLVGIGGGALTSPWQMWHGARPHQAVATSSACGFPIAVAGSLGFLWFGTNVDIPQSTLGYVYLPAWGWIAVFGALSAPLGAGLAHRLPAELLRRLFGAFLCLVGLRMMVGF